jgi:hypothetical protein
VEALLSILEQLGTVVTPELMNQIGSGLGVDTSRVSEGMGAVAPVVLGSLSKQASTPGGAEALFEQLSQSGSSSPLGGLIGALGGAGDTQGGENPLGSLLGSLLGGAGGAGGAQGAGGENPLGGLLGSLLGGAGGTGAGGGNPLGGLLGSLLGGAGGAGAQRDPLTTLLGDGANAISGTLSERLGFDVRPLLTLAIPMIAGMINRQIKSGNLNPASMQKLLSSETAAFMQNPSNAPQSRLAQEALAAGDQAAALRARFSNAEWATLQQAPLAAVHLVVNAAPSGQVGATRELSAAAGVVVGAARKAAPTSLLRTAFGSGLSQADFTAFSAQAPEPTAALAIISNADGLVARHSPTERANFRAMVMATAEQAANAMSEGGIMGVGGTVVSAQEQAALKAISGALGG